MSKRSAAWNTFSSITKCGASWSTHCAIEPQRLWANRDELGRRDRIAAGEQRDVVALADELLGQVGHDPLRTAVVLRRDGLVERRDLCNPHAWVPPSVWHPRLRCSFRASSGIESSSPGNQSIWCHRPGNGGKLFRMNEVVSNGAVREHGPTARPATLDWTTRITSSPRRRRPASATASSSRATRSPSSTTTATSARSGMKEQGLFHEGTRFLSCLVLRLGRGEPLFLSSTVKEDNAILAVDLTNPDIRDGDRDRGPARHAAPVPRHLPLARACATSDSGCGTTALVPIEVVLLAPVRGRLRRHLRGPRHDAGATRPHASPGRRGRHGGARVRGTRRRRPPHAAGVLPAAASGSPRPMPTSQSSLDPQEEATFHLTVAARSAPADLPSRRRLRRGARPRRRRRCGPPRDAGLRHLHLQRAVQRLAQPQPRRPRHDDHADAARALPLRRRAVVQHAVRSRRHHHRAADASGSTRSWPAACSRTSPPPRRRRRSPSRTPSRARSCTRPAAARWPRSARSRSAATTAASTRRRCSSCWPARTTSGPPTARSPSRSGRTSSARLQWIDRYGDRDGDGFVEYHRQSADGLVQQGWKDSHDSVFHADGTLAEGRSRCARCRATSTPPSAARRELAVGARSAGRRSPELGTAGRSAARAVRGRVLVRRPGHLRPRARRREAPVPRADVQPRPLPVHRHRRAQPGRAGGANAAWPTRRSPAGESARWPRARSRYNPMSYHNGSVWPHDNALIARGPGAVPAEGRRAARSWPACSTPACSSTCTGCRNCSAASTAGPARARRSTRSPARRRRGPRGRCSCSCRPASACASTAATGRVYFDYPLLPEFLREVRVRDLRVGTASVDLLLTRRGDDVGVNVLGRRGAVEVVLVK